MCYESFSNFKIFSKTSQRNQNTGKIVKYDMFHLIAKHIKDQINNYLYQGEAVRRDSVPSLASANLN